MTATKKHSEMRKDSPVTQVIPDSEVKIVKAKQPRRPLTAQYKREILAAADACTQTGALGALLRREGLYSSCLQRWRRELAQGSGLEPKPRGRHEPDVAELREQLKAMERENTRLTRQLKQAELVIAAQKKIAELLTLTVSE